MIEKNEEYHRLGGPPAQTDPVALTEIGKTDAAKKNANAFSCEI